MGADIHPCNAYYGRGTIKKYGKGQPYLKILDQQGSQKKSLAGVPARKGATDGT
jgi:hypothetical protein